MQIRIRPVLAPALHALLVSSALALAASSLRANEVYIVNTLSVITDFESVQEAVDAASDGDVIMVQEGPQGNVVIDGKALTVIREPWFTEPSFFKVTVKNLAANQQVVLRGLSIGINNIDARLCEIVDCDGPVFAEDCLAYFDVRNSANVVITRCQTYGSASSGLPHPNPEPTGPAIRVEGSFVSVYQSNVNGGSGVWAGIPPFMASAFPSQAGAPAIEVVSGTCFVAGSIVRGGNGGGGYFSATTGCLPGSAAAPAVLCDGALAVMDSTFFAGVPGPNPAGCPPALPQPPPIVLGPSGKASAFSETLRRLEVTSPGIVANDVWTRFEGSPGDAAILLVSSRSNGAFLLALKGALVGTPPFIAIPLGVAPADGKLSFKVTLPPALPPSVEGVVLYEQCVVAGASGTGLLSSPSICVIADP